MTGANALSGTGRYQVITENLINVWEEIKINEKLLNESYNIPKLYKLADKKYENFGKEEEDEFRIDEIEEKEKKKKKKKKKVQEKSTAGKEVELIDTAVNEEELTEEERIYELTRNENEILAN